ncbi:MAG TPA: hypothetical protein VL475_08520, partial [Planctomycetaceae bacterium]|nr:hypothetical protein [Planctomycetaceae bacterium]
MDEARSKERQDSEGPNTAASDDTPAIARRRLPLARLLLAMALTPSILIYNYGVVLVYGMMDGRLPVRELALLAGGIAVVMLLTAGLSRRLASPRIDRIVALTVGGVWLLVTMVLILLRSGESMPRPVLMA